MANLAEGTLIERVFWSLDGGLRMKTIPKKASVCYNLEFYKKTYSS